MSIRYAPVVIFTYNRLSSLKKTIESLLTCELVANTELVLFSDAAKNKTDFGKVSEVRMFLNGIVGFAKVTIHHAERNKGLANSIIDGVTEVIAKYGKVIVLEDDLIVSANFLVYMNQALDFYEGNPKVFSIAGYSIPVSIPEKYEADIYFTPRASSWGWATWKNRWNKVDWEVEDYESFKKDKQKVAEFNKGGSDMAQMLQKQMKGKINSWAIRWCYHQYKTGSLTAYPSTSKIQNIGFSDQATHSNVFNRYKTILDDGNQRQFNFPDKVEINQELLAQFQSFFSVKTRVYNKGKTYLYKAGILKNNNG